jgi:dTDP-4-amino-4,6-dideoxygalactose transaminase
MGRIYLSPPHLSGREMELVRDAVASNWIAPLGPHVDAFEREFAKAIGVPYAAAVSSGTAALHLALRILAGDRGRGTRTGRSNEVICSTFTFAATANTITYEGLTPVFIDCDAGSWNMDPGFLREELEVCAAHGKLPRAVIAVDLYGQCADYDPIVQACAEFEVPLIEDAAEALGAMYWGHSEVRSQKLDDRSQKSDGEGLSGEPRTIDGKGQEPKPSPGQDGLRSSVYGPRYAGCFGQAAAFSFNGNKILTTSGGGMLVSRDKAIVDKVRFLAT